MPDTPTPANGGPGNGDGDPTPAGRAAELQQQIDDLQGQLEESQKRIAGQTRSWQDEKARADAAEARVAKFEKYEFLLDDDVIEPSGGTPPAPSVPNPNDQTAAQISQMRLDLMEAKYIGNPDNREKAHIVADPKLKQMALQEAGNLAVKERQEYGHQVSSDDELFAKGVDEVAKFVDTLKADGAKLVEEERRGMPGNVNLGKGRGSQPSSDGPEQEVSEEYNPLTPQEEQTWITAYADDKRDAQNKMRYGK